jgi:hypothetical protein
MFLPSPGKSGFIRLINFLAVKGRVRTTSAQSRKSERSREEINKTGTPFAFSRKDRDIRFPVVRMEAALMTIRSGSEVGKNPRASSPVLTTSIK